MGNLAGFNAAEVEPASFDLVTPGEYTGAIVQSEIKPTKDRSGQFLELVWQILEGQFSGRKIFDRLNIQNPTPKTEAIAQQQLSAICHAVGIIQPNDSNDLHDIPVLIKVGISKGTNGYEDSNNIKSYKPLSGASTSPRPAAQASQSVAQAQPAMVAQAQNKPASKPGPAWAR